jgi:hypothetical protein
MSALHINFRVVPEHRAEGAEFEFSWARGQHVPIGGSATAWHGTSVAAFAEILGDGCRVREGHTGSVTGVYHTEERRTAATSYMFAKSGPASLVLGPAVSELGALLKLKVCGLKQYRVTNGDTETSRFPSGPRWGWKQARWRQNNGRHQSVSFESQLEIVEAVVSLAVPGALAPLAVPATSSSSGPAVSGPAVGGRSQQVVVSNTGVVVSVDPAAGFCETFISVVVVVLVSPFLHAINL